MRNNFDTYKTIGLGSPKRIAIAMNGHGIGDDISAMPAITQKISEGYEITVFCKSFSRKCWTSLGCKVYPSVNPKNEKEDFFKFGCFIGETFEGNREVFELAKEFGVIYETPQWSVWKKEDSGIFFEDRIQAFADLIETTLPENFSWIDALKPKRIYGEFTLFAPDSASTNRTIINQKKLYSGLKKNSEVVVFGQHAIYHKGKIALMPRHDKKDLLRTAFSKLYTKVANGITNFRNHSIDKNKILCTTFDEFLAYIYTAKFVVTTDNGVMNAARAFGVPCFSMFGSTPNIASDQYDRYVKASSEVVKCEFDKKGIHIEDSLSFILERTNQWQKQHIMA